MYDYDIDKRFSEKNARWYECYLEDSLYKSDSVGAGANTGSGAKGGRKLKSFYDELCRHIFDINLNLLEQIGDFPIVYNERSNSAAIAMALSCLTPYVISEYGVDCRGVSLGQEGEKHRRTIDFWCAIEDNRFDIWIESKHLWLNVGKNTRKARWEFSSRCIKRIKEAITQVRDIGQLQQAGKLADYDSFKLALFSINVYCAKEQAPDMQELDSIPYEVAEMIQNVANDEMGVRPQGVLCSALDLRPSIDTPKQNIYHLYEKEYLPFILLGAVVLP